MHANMSPLPYTQKHTYTHMLMLMQKFPWIEQRPGMFVGWGEGVGYKMTERQRVRGRGEEVDGIIIFVRV